MTLNTVTLHSKIIRITQCYQRIARATFISDGIFIIVNDENHLVIIQTQAGIKHLRVNKFPSQMRITSD